jgi:Spy/CpxP family protein refolding chaperone
LSAGVIGAGGLAMAAMPGHPGWRHGPRLGMVQHFVREALDSVGATSAQEDKVHDIVAAVFSDMEQDRTEREAMRKQALDLLRAPTINRNAVEKLRSDQVARFEARTKKMTGALLDAADQLTPEQRGKLVDRFERMAEHRGWRERDIEMMRGPGHFARVHDRTDGRNDGDRD